MLLMVRAKFFYIMRLLSGIALYFSLILFNSARANLELQANNAKQLWLAVQSLGELLNSKAEDVHTANSTLLVNIEPSILKIKQSAPDNEFIQKILGSIAEESVKNGLWSEPDLRDRFHRLKSVCNRVALIDERGGTLFKYFISYLQSFFIFHTRLDKSKLDAAASAAASPDLNETGINLNDTFNILDHAEYFVENGNLELALRLMQQLKGEPNRLARDWIRDAIRLIEIKQACVLINAYISSVYIGTNFK
jgi:mitofilin